MRIAWFTPFAKGSAIGEVGKQICEELSKSITVDIWTNNNNDIIETGVNIITFKHDDNLSKLLNYDFIIYNFGNFAGYHREIYDVSRRYPGIVICHDQTMSSFFGQYYTFSEFGGDNSESGYKAYAEFLNKYCGKAASEEMYKGKSLDYFPIYEYGELKKIHLLEPVLENSLGLFSHAEFFCGKVKSFYNRPMSFSYLPCKIEEKAVCRDKRIGEIISSAKKQNKRILVSNGIVHPVKQIDKIAEVLKNNPKLAQKTIYIVIGSYGGDYGKELEALAENELKGCLFMLGYQPYDVMNYAIHNADMCINLRYPNSEVCSLSLLEQMSYGKPVLVLNSGIYGEIPDNAVIKISYEDIYQGITENITALINGKNFSDYGKQSRKFISEKCNVKVYCKNLLSFIENLETDTAVKNLQNSTLNSICTVMDELGIDIHSAPATFSHVINLAEELFNGKNNQPKTVKTVGVWSAFYYEIPGLAREGISRFMGNMIAALVRNYNVNVESWCYSFNEAECRKMFSDVPEDKIKFITEKNWASELNAAAKDIACVGEVTADKDNLNAAARVSSKADIMLPLIIYLDSVIGTDKRVFVPAHDMVVSYHFDEFVSNDKNYKFRQSDILARAENLAKNNAFFLTISDSVRQKQILNYIRRLKPENTQFVYLPVMIPNNIEKRLIEKSELLDKFGISDKYIFYPTQIRPYKNFQTLFKALDILNNRGVKITLVITGNPADVPEVKDILEKVGIKENVKRLNNLSEVELYSLYKYAETVPVPSLFEGGFPLQACEAMYMKVPVVLANIDVVRERVKYCGFDLESCGLNIVSDPLNAEEMADKLEYVLSNRDNTIQNQQKFADILLNYTWDDAAKIYYKLLNER